MTDYQDFTYSSPSLIKRFLHQKRFADALMVLDLQQRDIFLDYGCGDGYLLKLATKEIPSKSLFGYEPADEIFLQAKKIHENTGVTIVNNLGELPAMKFSKISCLETCEHLVLEDLQKLLQNVSNLLDQNGAAFFSVPVEIYLPGLGKNLYRLSKKGEYGNLNLKNILNTLFGRKAERQILELNGLKYIFSHIGFHYREFEKVLSQYFQIEKTIGSPAAFLPKSLNNTLYYVCRKLS